MQNMILEFEKISFAYPGSKDLFKGVSIAFEKGRLYLIKGPSGCGKSTFLRLINRLEEPTMGAISFKGRSNSSYDPTALRQAILYIQQVPQVMDLSVRDNLLLPFTFSRNQDIRRPEDEQLQARMRQLLLDDVGLDDPAKTLSTGQQQRICFIRGLLLSPEVVLLDEPTSALDAGSCGIVQEMAGNLCQERGVTVLMVSHRAMEACTLDSLSVTIDQGRIQA